MNKASQRAKELEEYRAEQKFHEHEWAVQRVGWTLVAIVLIAAVAGLFGGGPMARQAMAAGDTRIEMDRFVRYKSSSEWRFRPGPSSNANPLRISIDSNFLAQYEITTITPRPSRTSSSGNLVMFEFERDRSTADIVFHVQPIRMWRHEGVLRVRELPPITVRQFVYP